MLAIAQRVPPEILDDIFAYVVDFEDDQGESHSSSNKGITTDSAATESITTLHSTLLTCRSFYQPSLRALHFDPSRSASKITWNRAVRLLETLQTKPDLARCVKRLTQFDTYHETLQSQAQGSAEFSEDDVGKWAIGFLLACPKVETLCTPVRLRRSMPIIVSILDGLEFLKHLTVRGPSGFRNGEDIDVAQGFVSQLHPKQGCLVSLKICRFEKFDLFGGDRIPEPAGEHPSFQVKRIEFDSSQFDIAWSPLFLPSDPYLLRSLSYCSFTEFNVEVYALEELGDKTSNFLETFIFRGRGTEREGILGSLEHYEEIHDNNTVSLPLQILGNDYPQLTNLVLEGIHFLHLSFFDHIATFPHLSTVSFFESIWNLEEWDDPSDACDALGETIESGFPALLTLHLGHLPILASDDCITPIIEICEETEIVFDFQPCLDSLSEWELGQIRAMEECRKLAAAMATNRRWENPNPTLHTASDSTDKNEGENENGGEE
ncbi:hypothetical protein JCM5353_008019 [Sporobolomyces roseus]